MLLMAIEEAAIEHQSAVETKLRSLEAVEDGSYEDSQPEHVYRLKPKGGRATLRNIILEKKRIIQKEIDELESKYGVGSMETAHLEKQK